MRAATTFDRRRFRLEEDRERRVVEAVHSAVDGRYALSRRLSEKDDPDPETVIRHLAEVFASRVEARNIRLEAADVLLNVDVSHRDDCIAYSRGLHSAFGQLDQAAGDPDYEIRIRSIQLMDSIGLTNQVIRAFSRALDDHVPQVVLEVVKRIHALSPSHAIQKQRIATDLVPQLCKLIKVEKCGKKGDSNRKNRHKTKPKTDDETCSEVIRILRELQKLAIDGIRPLALLALSEGFPADYRLAAVKVLTVIDSGGKRIISRLRDVDDIEELAKMMLCTWPYSLGDSLRQWCSDTLRGPSVGFARLQMKDLRTYIFGHLNVSGDGGKKRISGNRTKRIEGWLDSGVLIGMRVKRGIYDVREDGLERIRKVYYGKEPKDD